MRQRAVGLRLGGDGVTEGIVLHPRHGLRLQEDGCGLREVQAEPPLVRPEELRGDDPSPFLDWEHRQPRTRKRLGRGDHRRVVSRSSRFVMEATFGSASALRFARYDASHPS